MIKSKKEYKLLKFHIFKTYVSNNVKTPNNRIDLNVIWWEGLETPVLEYRRFYFVKKYDSWMPSKQAGMTRAELEIIKNNMDEINQFLDMRLDKTTGEPVKNEVKDGKNN